MSMEPFVVKVGMRKTNRCGFDLSDEDVSGKCEDIPGVR